MAGLKKKQFLFVVTEHRYFQLHWLSLAQSICRAGGRVTLVTRMAEGEAQADLPGLEVVHLDLARGLRPFKDCMAAWRLLRIFRQVQPEVAQLVSLKAALLGGLPALLAGVPRLVLAIQGFGYLFSSASLGARLAARLLTPAFKWLVNRPRCMTVVQNREDEGFVRGLARRQDAVALIPGVGVDLKRFHPSAEPRTGDCRVLLPSRFLWSKGVGVFVEAARALQGQRAGVRMILAGGTDPGNPDSIPDRQLAAWMAEGLVENWGYQQDMAPVYRQVHIVCLPTAYREGLPTVLLEAAASGRAIIASDTPGCRELVQHGKTGLLAPPKDSAALAQAILQLAQDSQARARYAKAARAAAQARFASPRINAAYLRLYN